MINSCKIRASAPARSSLSPSRFDGTKRDWGTLFLALVPYFIDSKHRIEFCFIKICSYLFNQPGHQEFGSQSRPCTVSKILLQLSSGRDLGQGKGIAIHFDLPIQHPLINKTWKPAWLADRVSHRNNYYKASRSR